MEDWLIGLLLILWGVILPAGIALAAIANWQGFGLRFAASEQHKKAVVSILYGITRKAA